MTRGRRRAERPGAGRKRLLALGAVAALLGWLLLVVVAIHLGQAAAAGRDGSSWTRMVVVAAGATGCLTVAFVLLARLRSPALSRRSPAGQHRR